MQEGPGAEHTCFRHSGRSRVLGTEGRCLSPPLPVCLPRGDWAVCTHMGAEVWWLPKLVLPWGSADLWEAPHPCPGTSHSSGPLSLVSSAPGTPPAPRSDTLALGRQTGPVAALAVSSSPRGSLSEAQRGRPVQGGGGRAARPTAMCPGLRGGGAPGRPGKRWARAPRRRVGARGREVSLASRARTLLLLRPLNQLKAPQDGLPLTAPDGQGCLPC